MPTILMAFPTSDGSGKVRKQLVTIRCWHRMVINSSNGPQPLWYYITVSSLGAILTKSVIYEDQNPHIKATRKHRIYRWDVFPYNCGYSFARGESITLGGAKIMAEKNADLFIAGRPYIESSHRR